MPDMQPSEMREILYNLQQDTVSNAIKSDPDFKAVLDRRDELRKEAEAKLATHQRRAVIEGNIAELKRVYDRDGLYFFEDNEESITVERRIAQLEAELKD